MLLVILSGYILQVLKTGFKERIETLLLENMDLSTLDCKKFLLQVEDTAIPILIAHLQKHTAIKFNLELFAQYVRKSGEEIEFSIVFSNKNDTNLR